MTLNLMLDSVTEAGLLRRAAREGVQVDQCALRIIEKAALEEPNRQRAIQLLQNLLDRADENTDENPDEFLRSLDSVRPSYRKLFPPELKGKSW